jgi:hypothetical protein
MSIENNKIIFENFTGEVTKEIEQIILNWLEEGASEIESQAIQKTGTGAYHRNIAENWTHIVDKGKYEATIGNPLEAALWVEFGTGEYAINGDGRKDWWVFIEGSTGKSNNESKHYKTEEEAKRTVAYLRSKGIKAGYTKGQEAKRPLHHAFNNNEALLKDLLKDRLGSMK